MRPVVPAVGLLIVAAALTVSSCASSGSANSAAASESVVAVSSPAAGSASTTQVSSSASTVQVSSPAAACPPVAGWPSGSRSPAPNGQLFVAGSPTLATLCLYVLFTADGSSLPPPVSAQISGPTLTDLVASLNELVPTKDEPPCPGPLQADVLTSVTRRRIRRVDPRRTSAFGAMTRIAFTGVRCELTATWEPSVAAPRNRG